MRPVPMIDREDSAWSRRQFLRGLGVAGGAALAAPVLAADSFDAAQTLGLLIDTTRCVGCRTCERVCAEVNGLPEPPEPGDAPVTTGVDRFTVVNDFKTDAGWISVKRQCMHCLQPACASACLTRAMLKTDEGPVIWREDKCMGCRYCMLSCPFDVPKFEYDSANPRIRKCALCWSRVREGGMPACAESCPAEAILFGKRGDLLEEARRRIATSPDAYVHHIYGETEAGGTSVLYLAAAPFEQLGFPAGVESESYPSMTREFLYGVPAVLILWPAFLLALNRAGADRESDAAEVTR